MKICPFRFVRNFPILDRQLQRLPCMTNGCAPNKNLLFPFDCLGSQNLEQREQSCETAAKCAALIGGMPGLFGVQNQCSKASINSLSDPHHQVPGPDHAKSLCSESSCRSQPSADLSSAGQPLAPSVIALALDPIR